MRGRCNFLEAERRTAALDRVGNAENRVDALGIRRAEIEFEQRRLHRIERLEALFEKRVVELCKIEHHRAA
jgi:hypothetical protein